MGTKRDARNHLELDVAGLKLNLLQGVSWWILDDEFWRTYGEAAYFILQRCSRGPNSAEPCWLFA